MIFAEVLLRATCLRHCLDVVVGGDALATIKPSAAPLLHACRLLGVESQRALMVRDSSIDVAAACASGMPAWLIVRDDQNKLAPGGGASVIDSFDHLPARLASALI